MDDEFYYGSDYASDGPTMMDPFVVTENRAPQDDREYDFNDQTPSDGWDSWDLDKDTNYIYSDDSEMYDAEGPDGSNLGNGLSDFFGSIFRTARDAVKNVANNAIRTGESRANSAINPSGGNSSTTTNTTSNRTTIMGLTANQALAAAAVVGVLVFFAARGVRRAA